jgi:YVTN family beta-propeller protein
MDAAAMLARLAATLVAASVLASCGGGDAEPTGRDGKAARERPAGLPPGTQIPADADSKGMFGPVQPWPLIAVHGVMTSDGRILSYGTKEDGKQTGYFVYDIWDPRDGSHMTLANGTGTDIFCSSQMLLPDGTGITISGGDNWTTTGTTNTGNNNATLLDVATGSLTRGTNMNRARWYSSSTMLLNGEIYVQGGTGGTDRPEIRGADGVYRVLAGANTAGFNFMYPRNFVAPDGRVFGYDSAGKMYYVDPNGVGTVTTAGQFTNSVAGNDSSAAMFAPGRILQYGGNSNLAIVIDINGTTPTISTTASMLRQRRLSTATLLADGKVLATGGSRVWNAMTDVSYEAEIWNPQTGQWTVGASAVKPRLYHGNALLLPDATVLVFGGGAPSPSGVPGNLNAEIYYPPYLFAPAGALATRPVIESAPTVVDTGRTVQVAVTSAREVSRVTFVKTGSATHGWNMDQRFVDLPFNEASDGALAVQIPARASDVPPGTWMMFVIDDAGVPSEAQLVRVNVAAAMSVDTQPVLTPPGVQSSLAGAGVSLQIAATDPNGDVLRYSASGLPSGLSIDTATGMISGTPTVVGYNTVVLAVSDGINSSSATFSWQVNSPAPLVLNAPPAIAPTAVGAAANFSASAAGQLVQYRWDFGDGSPPSEWSNQPEASHTYSRAGVYYVTVTASNVPGVEQRQTIVHNVQLALSANAPAMSSDMLLEPLAGANARLWVVNPDNDSVTAFDSVTRAKLAEIAVGAAPRTLALAADGSIWVVNKRSASISVIDPGQMSITRTVSLPRASQPYGIAMARNSSSALVALEASGTLLKIDTTSFAVTDSLSVGPNPRHVAVAADGATAWVSRFVTPPLPGESTETVLTRVNDQPVGAELVVVNSGVPGGTMSVQRTVVLAHSEAPDTENSGRGIPNYLGAVAISPDGTQAFVPSKQDNILRGGARDRLMLNFQNTVRAVSSRIDLSANREDLAARIDHDNASVASAAAFDPLGVYLFVALETSREVAVLDAHNTGRELMRIDVGRAPQGLVVSADRRTLYVHNFMDRTVGVFDLSPLLVQGLASATPVATLATVANEKLSSNVLRGKQFFYDARDTRLARDRYMSCASCHNDGGHDGRVWDLTSQGEGLRNTINLRGRAGAHGHLHWSNNFDEVQDFEGQIRTLAGGSGLMRDADFDSGTRNQPLGDAKAGVSTDLDALAAYVASLGTPDPSPFRASDGNLSALAAEGKAVFAALNCASCHSGTTFTRSATNNPVDIGTLKQPTSGQRLSGLLGGIDVPTLRDIWATAPYLHDGSAATLGAAVRRHNTVTIGDADLQRLVAFLQQIGSEEPIAPTYATGGLSATYFNNATLTGTPVLSRTEAVNFDWASGRPAATVNTDYFSVRWVGSVIIPASGNYQFRTVSDDGVRLWVNASRLINNWTNHAAKADTSVAIPLIAGQRVPVTLEYYERTGKAVMKLQWLVPGATSFVAIPASSLSGSQ